MPERGDGDGSGAGRGALDVAGIDKRFGAQQVLREAAFTVPSGQFATLLGPSGCGKTTMLRIIAGFELPDRGGVRLDGVDIGALPANRRPVNTVFQSYALFPHLTVHDNIAFGLRARRIAAPEIAKRADQALEMLRIGELRDRRVPQLSGGQRQRVALARALVNQPDVLLLDEPMSALDARLRAEVQLELKRLQRRLGTTFLLVTHDQDEAMVVSDRILVMEGGRIVQSGTPEDVYERPTTRFAAEFLGAANVIAATRADPSTAIATTAIGDLAIGPSASWRPSWQGGLVAIRPERVRVSATRPARNGVRAQVRERVYRGGEVDLICDPGPLRVRVAPADAPAQGSEIWLELPAEHLVVLDG